MPVRVLIADADPAGRAMARRAIEGVVEIAGEATSDAEAMRLAMELGPDIILIDIDLARGGGLPLTQGIKAMLPGIKVILMTGHEEERYLSATGKSGADAFLPKRRIIEEALAVVRTLEPDLARRWDGRERRRAQHRHGVERRRSSEKGPGGPQGWTR